MPIKKSDLYSSLWKSCDELRGGMDASQYKDYVLVLLFVKYVSDKYAGQRDALLDVPKGGGFADMVALKGDKEIGDRINKIIGRLAEANDLRGVIDVADFNDADKLGRGKEMVDRLSNLVSIFDNPALDFRGNRAEGDDLLGDAYEYLMRYFATESGKSKGQFYTPAEVSRIMAKVISIGSARSASQSVHDPTCGSASLLLKAHDEAKSMTGLDLTLYGQEMDNATAALARMNMILHDCPTAEIWKDNVLSSPHFKQADGSLKTFDFVVANFPFSTKAWSNGFNPAEDDFNRFAFGNAFLSFKLYRLFQRRFELQNGLEAELAMGQELDQLMRDGAVVFHDFPAEGFNIDHVVLTRGGMFAVATKGRMKPDRGRGARDAKVEFTGEVLSFPDWRDTKTLEQAKRQAKWLTKWISSAVGESIGVKPVVALPGWYVERTGRADVTVISGREAPALLKGWQSVPFSDQMMTRIAHQLEQRCRDVEPTLYGKQDKFGRPAR